MKSTILKYLNDLLEFEENSLVNIKCDLLDSECVGKWRAESIKEKKKVKFRVNELQECIKFLNVETVEQESLLHFMMYLQQNDYLKNLYVRPDKIVKGYIKSISE